jgi:hypothetical protein
MKAALVKAPRTRPQAFRCGHGGSTPPPGTNKTKSLIWIGLYKPEMPKSFGGCFDGCWLWHWRAAGFGRPGATLNVGCSTRSGTIR